MVQKNSLGLSDCFLMCKFVFNICRNNTKYVTLYPSQVFASDDNDGGGGRGGERVLDR